MPSKGIQAKQPKARVRRALKEREAKIIENTKKALVIRGKKTSDVILHVLKDIHRLRQPDSLMFSKKNDLNPFEDETNIEFLTKKNDTSLFAFGSHNKKRPHNLVLGRTYDGHMLDMVELGVENYKGVDDFKGVAKRVGSKPTIAFVGDQWEQDEGLQRVRNLILDFFRGEVVNSISLGGIDHLMMLTEHAGKIYLRHYHIQFQKSGSLVPLTNLTPMGPSMDLTLRRTKFPSKELWKEATRKAKAAVAKKVKNKSTNEMGEKLGRIHLGRQDLSSMKVRRVKALRDHGHKRKPEESSEANVDAASRDTSGAGRKKQRTSEV